MRYLTPEEIDGIARRVVTAYKKLPAVQETECLYIDPQLLVTRLLGLTLEFRHLSLDGSTLGLTSYDEGGVQIYDDADEEELYYLDGKTLLVERDLGLDPEQTGRCNFTIMHEGCHQIYRMLYPQDCMGISARRVFRYEEKTAYRGARSNREEMQANALTSAILMPEELIERAMGYAGLEKRIEILNRIWRRAEFEKFETMCTILGVSKHALAIRMQKLDYLGKEYLAHPNSIADIYMEVGESA